MAVGIKNGFADGWQKEKSGRKQYSEVIRDNHSRARESSRNMESARASQADRPKAPEGQRPARTADQAKQGHSPKAQQRVAREQAAQRSDEAGREYLQAKAHARGLNELATRTPAQHKGAEVATKESAARAGSAQDADASTQAMPKQATTHEPNPTQAHAKQGEHAPKPQPAAAKAKPAKKGTQKDAPKTNLAKKAGEAQRAQDPKQVAEKSAVPAGELAAASQPGVTKASEVTSRDDADFDEDVDEEKDSRESSTFALGNKGKKTTRDLGALLGGSGGQGGGDSEAEPKYAIDISKGAESAPIPDEAPGLAVYSEFDSEEVGPETYLQKHRIFAEFVEKKLKRIAELDASLDEEIRNTFETTPLSQRIIGEIGIAVSKFNGSVYGEGMISG